MDLNQTSRLRAYAQLKLLLSLDASLDDDFKDEIARRVESSTLNPLQNDTDAETKIARAQYNNLVAYAKRPDGLAAKIMDDRREEMIRLNHGFHTRAWFSTAHFLSFGLYTHREDATPERMAQMDIRRQLDFHERILREVAFASARPEIDSNVEKLRNSLLFVSQNGSAAKEKTTRALSKIFAATDDESMQTLCLTGLYRINNSSAKKELLAIYNNQRIAERWRDVSAHYLKLALQEGQRMSARDAQLVANFTAN